MCRRKCRYCSALGRFVSRTLGHPPSYRGCPKSIPLQSPGARWTYRHPAAPTLAKDTVSVIRLRPPPFCCRCLSAWPSAHFWPGSPTEFPHAARCRLPKRFPIRRLLRAGPTLGTLARSGTRIQSERSDAVLCYFTYDLYDTPQGKGLEVFPSEHWFKLGA